MAHRPGEAPDSDHARTRVLLRERLCLDFANSANWVDGAPVEDAFRAPRDVAVWLGRALRIDPATIMVGPRTPARLVRARDTLRGVLAAIAREEMPDIADLAALNATDGAAGLRIEAERGSVASPAFSCTAAEADAADWAPTLMARSAQELVLSEDRTRLKICDGPRCGWLFLDRSPRGARRWCRMETCGNRAKARDHYARRAGALRTP